MKRLVSSDDQMGISLEIGPEELPTEVVSVSEETTLDSGAPAPTEALLATGVDTGERTRTSPSCHVCKLLCYLLFVFKPVFG